MFVEGKEDRKSRRNITIFDPTQPLSVRLAFLGGEKLLSGTLPFEQHTGESWVLLLQFEKVELLGYVKVIIKAVCRGDDGLRHIGYLTTGQAIRNALVTRA